MNRRKFLSFLAAAAAAIPLLKVLPLNGPRQETSVERPAPFPETFGAFTVEPDGILSLDGQRKFPVYGVDGGLSCKYVSYRLVNGVPQKIIVAKETR